MKHQTEPILTFVAQTQRNHNDFLEEVSTITSHSKIVSLQSLFNYMICVHASAHMPTEAI